MFFKAGPSNSEGQQNKQVYKIMLEPERPPPSPIDAGENPRTIAVPPRREEGQTQRSNPRARAIDLEPPTSEMENMQVRSDSSSPAVFHLSMDSSPRKNPNDPRVSQSRQHGRRGQIQCCVWNSPSSLFDAMFCHRGRKLQMRCLQI